MVNFFVSVIESFLIDSHLYYCCFLHYFLDSFILIDRANSRSRIFFFFEEGFKVIGKVKVKTLKLLYRILKTR